MRSSIELMSVRKYDDLRMAENSASGVRARLLSLASRTQSVPWQPLAWKVLPEANTLPPVERPFGVSGSLDGSESPVLPLAAFVPAR